MTAVCKVWTRHLVTVIMNIDLLIWDTMTCINQACDTDNPIPGDASYDQHELLKIHSNNTFTGQIAMAINSVGLVLVYALLVMTGVAMFAFYSECHPVSFNIIDKDMQTVTQQKTLTALDRNSGSTVRLLMAPSLSITSFKYVFLVMDILGDVPGLPGFLMSSILCGSLRFKRLVHHGMKVQGDYSITTGKIKTFGLADYGVTSAMLVVSAAVGIFYVIKDRHRGTMTEYVLGGRHMHYIPVSMSLMVTFISALSLLGAPVEVYRSNTMMIWLPVAAVAGVLVAGRIFIPFFYKLQINNVFKYLEMRFNKAVRKLALTLILIQTMVHTAMVLYAPSLAVSSVTGLNVWALVFVFGSVTTLCTALGGMKAVLWTDTFQAVVMVVGIATLMVRSAAAVGGFRSAWAIADNRSRIKLDEFSLDPTTRYSVWSFMVGGTVMMTAMYGVHQAEVQRTLSCSSLGYAQIAMAINSAGLVLVYALLVMTGVAMFAFYSECHPVSFNIIDKDMQLLPLLVMDILGDVPGLPGLIMSSILCGSLSTVSSVLNALGTVIPDDFITPFCLKDLSDKGQTRLAKTTVLVCGVIEMCLAVLASKVGILFQAVQSVSAVFLGPTLGLFSLGMFCPWANVTGAICGFVSAFVLTGWIAVGAFVHKVGRSPIPSSTLVTDGCNWNLTLLANLTSETTTVMTTPTNINMTSPLDSEAELNFPYTISFMYYQAIGVCVVLVVGIIVSVITGPTSPKSLDPRLICPVFDRVFPYLPEWFLKPLRFGIVHDGKYNKSRAGSSQMDPKGDAETFL